MRIAAALVCSTALTTLLLAEVQHVVSDTNADFASVKTFAIREGSATTRRPELNNKVLFGKVEDAIRTQLVSKGLKETPDRPDVVVGFTVGEDRPNGPSVVFNQGMLQIEMTARDSNHLIWQGVYRDQKSTPAKVAEKLPGNVKKLLSDYPPKKKK